jgi:hypothetical protein
MFIQMSLDDTLDTRLVTVGSGGGVCVVFLR